MDVIRAKTDSAWRNRIIQHYRPYVRRIASSYCRRMLEWGRDEELSIALIALDAAIDKYKPDRGTSFESFAAMVIKRRLIDYLRKTNRLRKKECLYDQLPDLDQLGQNSVFLHFERVWELEEFDKMMQGMGISFATLARESPRHAGVRSRMLAAAKKIATDNDLRRQILNNQRLPLKALSNMTGETKKFLANRRHYLLALLAVADKAEDFPFISTYLGLGRAEDE